MNISIKNYLLSLSYILISIIIFSLIINTLYYFDLINNNIIKYLKMLGSIISFLIGGFYLGINSEMKAYLNGFKLSLFTISLFLVISLITSSLELKNIIYYLITIISITFGSMLGISKKNR